MVFLTFALQYALFSLQLTLVVYCHPCTRRVIAYSFCNTSSSVYQNGKHVMLCKDGHKSN